VLPCAPHLPSLINSCKLQKIDPFEYLRDVINRTSTHPASRVAELTPRAWKAARAQAAR
jgi:transposase